jgi:hypothetical protein
MPLLAIFWPEISLRFQRFGYRFLFPAEQGFFSTGTGIIRRGTGILTG